MLQPRKDLLKKEHVETIIYTIIDNNYHLWNWQMSKYKTKTQYLIRGYLHNCPVAYRNRLLSLGLLPGKILEIKRKAILGGPCQVSVRNADISIRIKELDLLDLEEIKS